MLLSEDPSMKGRELAGHSATIATHQPALTSTASPPASSWPMRRRRLVGAATTYTSANAGRTMKACIIFARKAMPIITPVATIQPVPACSIARTRQ